MFHHLERLSGVAGSRYPQGNGQKERMNRTLLSMLRTLPEEKKTNWKDSLNKLIHAYNCTRHESTGFSPFQLMFGRSPGLPVGLMFDLGNEEQSVNYPDYVKKRKRDMQDAYSQASRQIVKSSTKSKACYDKTASSAVLYPCEKSIRKRRTWETPCLLGTANTCC